MRRAAAAIILGLTTTLACAGCPESGSASGGSGGGGLFGSIAGALSTAEIEKVHAEQGKTIEGALKLWLRACMRCADPLDAPRGRMELSYLTIPLKDAPLWYDQAGHRTFVTRLSEQPHIFRSYAKGATPANGYAANPASFEIEITRTVTPGPGETRGTQVYVKSGGTDSPRPVYLKQSTTTNLWYVSHFDNLYVDVKKVVDPTKETFR